MAKASVSFNFGANAKKSKGAKGGKKSKGGRKPTASQAANYHAYTGGK